MFLLWEIKASADITRNINAKGCLVLEYHHIYCSVYLYSDTNAMPSSRISETP